jgi:tRNA threonylcarbamoyladenosine biosynthesis protein TsaB
VALSDGERLVWEKSVSAGRKPSEVLMNPLGEALEGIPEGEGLGIVVIGTGPGSYNGARVAIAAGQGIGMVRGCAAVGVSSLEALETTRAGGRCLAVGDARRGTMWAVRLEEGRVVGEAELLEAEDLVSRVEAAVEEGYGVVTLEEVGRLLLPEGLEKAVKQELPQARLLLEAWWARSAEEREAVVKVPPEPFYLREAYITTPRKK